MLTHLTVTKNASFMTDLISIARQRMNEIHGIDSIFVTDIEIPINLKKMNNNSVRL